MIIRSILTFIMVASVNANICGWTHVRFLPGGSTKWFETTDQMAGTDSYGDSSSYIVGWSIPFSTMAFDQLLFMTNNQEHWVILAKSLFDPAVLYPNSEKTNIRSSRSQN